MTYSELLRKKLTLNTECDLCYLVDILSAQSDEDIFNVIKCLDQMAADYDLSKRLRDHFIKVVEIEDEQADSQ